MRRLARSMFIAFSLLVGANAGAATREITGQTPSGAWYRIDVPDGWKAGDAVVFYEHGFDFSTPSGPPSLGPLKDVALAEGYAIAASSFSERGWALFTAESDNRDLLAVFTQAFGAPGEMIPFGGSMGGLVALKLAEADGFPPVRGALAMCPAAAGARLWDSGIDLRLAYAVVCSGAGELTRGDAPLWWAPNLDMIPDNLGDLSNLPGLVDNAGVLNALKQVNQCTGINLPAYLRNDAMKRRLAELMAFTHITDEKFFLTNVGYSTFVLADLVRAPDKLAGLNPFSTMGVDYSSDPLVAANIARFDADPVAAHALRASSDFGGRVGSAKILSMHTSRDQLVIPGNEDFIRAVVPANQLTGAIVDEDAPTHCGFTTAEGLAAWEALRAWKDGAPQPGVANLQTACQAIVSRGIAAGPCRFDANAQVVPFDDIVRPHSPLAQRPLGHSAHMQPSSPRVRSDAADATLGVRRVNP